jgi:hypothetical protein
LRKLLKFLKAFKILKSFQNSKKLESLRNKDTLKTSKTKKSSINIFKTFLFQKLTQKLFQKIAQEEKSTIFILKRYKIIKLLVNEEESTSSH